MAKEGPKLDFGEATPDVMFTNPQHERTQAFLHAVLGSSDGQIGTH